MAQMVGPSGTVIAADLQPQMLDGLRRRAERAGLLSQIQLHQSQPEHLGVITPVDFALAFWMLHEVRNPAAFLTEVHDLLKPGARMLLVEPIIHVSKKQFYKEVQIARQQGFRTADGPFVRFSRSTLLTKEP
jgi:ubiquinone/menaquinone biosynthesis C-methylase UbiE